MIFSEGRGGPPLSADPEILGERTEPVLSFCLPDRLVDCRDDGLDGVQRILNGIKVLVGFGVFDDLDAN